jgi:hypothetical protein
VPLPEEAATLLGITVCAWPYPELQSLSLSMLLHNQIAQQHFWVKQTSRHFQNDV